MNFTKINQNEDFSYSIFFNENFYKIFSPYYDGDSYFNILYRLFGMMPQDFYHYVGATYKAFFKPSAFLKNHIYMQFKVKELAAKFADEIDRRITYCVNRGDFK